MFVLRRFSGTKGQLDRRHLLLVGNLQRDKYLQKEIKKKGTLFDHGCQYPNVVLHFRQFLLRRLQLLLLLLVDRCQFFVLLGCYNWSIVDVAYN